MKVFTNINENIPKNCVATIGFFDGVHKGHLYLLDKLSSFAIERNTEELLITLWPHPAKFFGRNINLLTSLEEKIELLSKTNIKNLLILPFNKEIASLPADEFVKTILREKLDCNSVLMGYNNSFGNKNGSNIPESEYAIPVKRLDKFETDQYTNINSSQIRECLQKGNVDKAAEMLGYDYKLRGKIVSGYKIGRKIGFPTANVGEYNVDKILPVNGVYICRVNLNGNYYPAMLNIGTRPSFDGKEKTIEFHIPNFTNNLYDSKVEISFLKKIRNEIKFTDIKGLIKQLESDKIKTLAYFAKNL